MFEFEKRVYENFRNKQIYDECCGDGVRKEYVITTNFITYTHMKGAGQSILSAFLKGSGWTLAFTEQATVKYIVLLWTGAAGKQTVLGAIGG